MTKLGAIITQFKVFIKQSDGVYSEAATDCPSSGVDLIANTQCTIRISTLRAAPYLLQNGQSIYSKIIAINSVGSSELSDEGTGSSVFVPVTPEAPLNFKQI
jgi:hypothetical protein